jgi:hypothetical protein
MPKVMRDEKGPWMDLGFHAIRPAGPTRFAEGDEVDEFHFGGSTIHGVGKVHGRGRYQEAWLSGPAGMADSNDFDWTWHCHVVDLAVLARGNPTFDPSAPSQNAEKLKRGREAYLASIGYTMGVVRMTEELAEQGGQIAGGIAAKFEADAIRRGLEGSVAGAKRKPGL